MDSLDRHVGEAIIGVAGASSYYWLQIFDETLRIGSSVLGVAYLSLKIYQVIRDIRTRKAA